jgi:hypothetical protein
VLEDRNVALSRRQAPLWQEAPPTRGHTGGLVLGAHVHAASLRTTTTAGKGF